MFSTRKGNMFGLFFVIHFLAGNLLLAFLIRNIPAMASILPSIGATQILLVFMPSVYYFIFYKTPFKATFRFYKTSGINILLSVLLAVSSIPIVMFVNVLSQFIFRPALDDTLAAIGNENYFLAILVIAVFPGIFEELISRGIILSHYKHTKIITTSLISGFFFGMMHMNMNQFMYAFVLGFLFSLVVHITGSIISSMIMHFIVNSVNLSLAFLATSDLFTSLPGYTEQQDMMTTLDNTQLLIQSLQVSGLLLIFSMPFFVGILFALVSFNNKLDLLRNNEISYKFFEAEAPEIETSKLQNAITEEELIDSLLIDDSNINSDLLADKIIVDKAAIATEEKSNQKIITIPLILTTLIFIIVAGITELI